VADFYSARSNTTPPLQWPTFAPPYTGSSGHPRKFASYPRKYQDYVQGRPLLTLEQFVRRSSALVAQTYGLCDRGVLATGKMADILVFDPDGFVAEADYLNPAILSTGVEFLVVNGAIAVDNAAFSGNYSGRALARSSCNQSD
jgi:N-acyl-D-aspartate/D-glutamate deacylase